MYRAKAKTLAQAVSRDAGGRMFSLEANYGTLLQRRLVYVELAEKTTDWNEFVRTVTAIEMYGSVRKAVMVGAYTHYEENYQ